MVNEVELVADTTCAVGETPLWHPEIQQVFFIDLTAGTIYTYSPSTSDHKVFSEGPVVGAMVLNEDGSIVLFQDGRVSILSLDGKQREVAAGIDPENERFNDAIVDPRGRVLVGTMGANGKLLRFDLDGSVTEIMDGLSVPNGKGFTPDFKQIYFTDSDPHKIWVFDYDLETGGLSNQRVLATFTQDEGFPDGMTTDADGYIWTAVWFGGRVVRLAPDGSLDREIRFPVTQVSAVTFGGADLDELYVTTAASDIADRMGPDDYDATRTRGGGLYRARVAGIRGVAPFRSRVRF